MPTTYAHTYKQLTLQEIIQTDLPEQIKDDFEERRFILDCCLDFAYKHGLMNSDIRERLKAKDQNFWSIFGELRIGNWLEHLGFSFKEFEPPAKGKGKGDYLVSTNQDTDIFIEVKVFSGDKDYCSQSDLLSRIADLTRKIRPEINEIMLEKYSFMDSRTRKIFLEKIHKFLKSAHLPGVFSDPGFHEIQISFNIRPDVPFSIGWAGFIGIEDKLIDLISSAQMSRNPISSVIFIYDLGSWARDAIENVLYGNRVIDTVIGKNYRKDDGIWKINRYSPLSAVGVLKFGLGNLFPSAVNLYLAPKARYPIRFCFSSAAKYMTLDSNRYDIVTI